MSNKIVLFLHTKEYKQMDTEPLAHIKFVRNRRVIDAHNEQLITSIHRWLSDDEIKVKEVVEDFAKSQHLELIVYDRIKFWDNMRANLKGIKTTPTVILGTHTFTTNITKEQLKNVLSLNSKN